MISGCGLSVLSLVLRSVAVRLFVLFGTVKKGAGWRSANRGPVRRSIDRGFSRSVSRISRPPPRPWRTARTACLFGRGVVNRRADRCEQATCFTGERPGPGKRLIANNVARGPDTEHGTRRGSRSCHRELAVTAGVTPSPSSSTGESNSFGGTVMSPYLAEGGRWLVA